jgi:AsmA-like C-terminal region
MQPAYYDSYEYNKPKAPRTQQPEGTVRTYSGVRKWLLLTAGISSALVLVLLALGWIFSDEIGAKAIDALGRELKTECRVGNVRLSMFRSFPHASIILQDVQIGDAFGKKLLTTPELNLDFDLLSLLSDRIVLDRITIRGGMLRLLTDAQGLTNWDIVRAQKDKAASQPITLDIHEAHLIGVTCTIKDEQVPYQLDAFAGDARFRGRFGAERFALASEAKVVVHQLDIGQKRWLKDTPIQFDASLMADLTKKAYSFNKCNLIIGSGNELALTGLMVLAKNHTDLNMQFAAKKGDINLLVHLLPSAIGTQFKSLRSTGGYFCNGTVKGRSSKSSYPLMQMQFGLQNAHIMHGRLSAPLKNVHFQADILLKPNGDGHVLIPDLKAMYEGAPIAMRLEVRDFRDPQINLHATGRLSLRAADTKTDTDGFLIQSGHFDIQQFALAGRLSDMRNPAKRAQVQVSGAASVQQLNALLNGKPLRIPQGQIQLQNNQMQVNQCRVEFAQSDFEVKASIDNFLPLALGEGADGMQFTTEVGSQYCDLDALMQAVQTSNGKQSKPGAGKPLLHGMKGQIQVDIANLKYQGVQSQQVHGVVHLQNQKAIFKASGKAMQGMIAIAGCAHLEEQMRLDINAGLSTVNLTECFAQANSFGQKVINDKNIAGTMTGRIAAQVYWDAAGNLLKNKMVVNADLLAHDGVLKNVKELEDFSRFIHLSDLRSVQFHTLQNYVEVRNGQIWLPSMYIQNNACNMTISGVHGFDNQIAYFVKVNAGQALFNRIRKAEPDGEILAANDGWVNLYYTMQGTMDHYTMARGRTAVRKSFEESTTRKASIAKTIDRAFAQYTPDFKMDERLRPILTDQPYTDLEHTDAQPEEEHTAANQKQEAAPSTEPTETKPKPRPARVGTSSIFPSSTKISQSDDDDFLDEIVGGGE